MKRLIGIVLTVSLLSAVGDGAAPNLNEEQWKRFYARYTGRWQLNPAKSLYFKGKAPQVGNIITYTAQPDGKSVKYMDDALHVLDGRENPMSTKPNEAGTVARNVLDEFTVANPNREHGRITAMSTHVLSPDGDARVHVRMSVDEHGKWTIDSVMYFERMK